MKDRHYLTLDKKVELIKYAQKNPGVFWQSSPDCGIGQKGKGEDEQRQVTLVFFVAASGKKEKPIFIWKSETL